MINYLFANDMPSLLIHYGYFIYLPLAVIEGPIITVVAGFLASLGYFNALVIYGLAILGDLIGDMLYYVLGSRGNEYLLKRKRFLWINIEQLKKLENHFDKHLGKTIILGKWTHAVGAPILIAAGMARASIKKFILFNIIGTAPKILAFLIIGYYFGQAYKRIDAYFTYAAAIIFFIIILIAIIYFLAKIFKREFNGTIDKNK